MAGRCVTRGTDAVLVYYSTISSGKTESGRRSEGEREEKETGMRRRLALGGSTNRANRYFFRCFFSRFRGWVVFSRGWRREERRVGKARGKGRDKGEKDGWERVEREGEARAFVKMLASCLRVQTGGKAAGCGGERLGWEARKRASAG